MSNVLDIQSPIMFDESISQYDIHAHKPYNTATFNNGDEIRISIQQQDMNLLPSKSSLHIFGRIVKSNNNNEAPTTITLVNNAICHLFREIRYELNGVEIDNNRNVGITSLMKSLVSFNTNKNNFIENANWVGIDETAKLSNAAGYFDVSIPLSHLLGFAEDYNKVIVNMKHELILTRATSDTNAVIKTVPPAAGADAAAVAQAAVLAAEDAKIHILNIEWLMPYLKLSDKHKINLLNYIAKDKPIRMAFRSWDLYEYPAVPQTMKHVWVVKTATQLEKPRFVIVGLQTDRKSNEKNASQFDHCKIRDVKLYLNSQFYPYSNMNLDFTKNQFAILYEMYTNFQPAYYNKTAKPILTKNQFLKNSPLFVIDCSKQNESLKSGSVDCRLEIEAVDNIPPETSAYCLIIHDRIIEYNPISSIVRKL